MQSNHRKTSKIELSFTKLILGGSILSTKIAKSGSHQKISHNVTIVEYDSEENESTTTAKSIPSGSKEEENIPVETEDSEINQVPNDTVIMNHSKLPKLQQTSNLTKCVDCEKRKKEVTAKTVDSGPEDEDGIFRLSAKNGESCAGKDNSSEGKYKQQDLDPKYFHERLEALRNVNHNIYEMPRLNCRLIPQLNPGSQNTTTEFVMGSNDGQNQKKNSENEKNTLEYENRTSKAKDLKNLQADKIWSQQDCEILEYLLSNLQNHKWLYIQAKFFNWTGRMISAEIIERKFLDDDLNCDL